MKRFLGVTAAVVLLLSLMGFAYGPNSTAKTTVTPGGADVALVYSGKQVVYVKCVTGELAVYATKGGATVMPDDNSPSAAIAITEGDMVPIYADMDNIHWASTTGSNSEGILYIYKE